MNIAGSTRPLPSLALLIGAAAFIVVALVMGVSVPHSWAAGLLAGLPFGLLLVAGASREWSRQRTWLLKENLPSRSNPAARALSENIQAGATPPRAEKFVSFAALALMWMIIGATALLLLPAILDQDMRGWEVTMRAVFAGGIAPAAVFLAPSRPGYEASDAAIRFRLIAVFAAALAVGVAWGAPG